MTKPKRRDWSKFSFKGVPTRVIEKELERRGSIAYQQNISREMRARRGFQSKREEREAKERR